jgi:hypothetical protein
MARRTSQEDYGWGSVLPAATAQPDLPPAEVYGPAVFLTNHREVPLSERRMVLYTYSAPDVSPADPCNKMASGSFWLPDTMQSSVIGYTN